MGGLGSGNRWRFGTRDTVEGTKSVDVRRWRRDGYFPGPRRFSWQWMRDGEPTGNISVFIQDRFTVKFSYRIRIYGEGDWEQVEQTIPVTWTQCHFGGERPWFVCSVYRNGVYCGRRVAKLYGAGKLFACRRCYDLAYQSQNEAPDGRLTLKAQRIRMKLGGSPSIMDEFPEKPKGMHWHTYNRLRDEAEAAEIGSWAGVAKRFGIDF